MPYSLDFTTTGGKKCLFFGKFGVLCFLEMPVLRFTLLPYYWWNNGCFSKMALENSNKSSVLWFLCDLQGWDRKTVILYP